mgnify:FL=1
MSRKPQKLKYGMWMYFLLFTVLVLGCVWGFQMLFVESYYQNMKLNEMYSYGRTLRAAENEYSDAYYEESVKCKEVGMNVYVVDRYGENVSSTGGYKPDVDTLDLLRTIMSDYAKSSRDEVCKLKDTGRSADNYFYYVGQMSYDNNRYLVLISRHAMLTEVMRIIRWQFLIITGIVLIIGFFLAWYVASKLSKPISEMSVTAKRWANGDESAVFEPASNYSEITELADALNYAKEGISKSGTLQRDLLANVSHDLRTPLTMIKAYAEMIKDISGDNKQKRDKHTGVIIEEADRLTMLVNDILNLSKLQSSVDELELKEINLSELTERVIDRFSDFVENRGYKIEDNVAPDLLTVADEKKIEQVIYNLLGNSINYTGEDKTVKVYLTAENDKILLEIIDSGKGISEEKLATIWERYYRFSETNTRPVKGTGLGLSIVKAILDSHGLKFGVRSKKDCGSNFYVEFDRVKNNE